MKNLKQYIIALTNLYGIVHKDKVLEIYNNQNEEHVALSEIEALIYNLPEDVSKKFVQTHRECFVHEAIMEFNEFDVMLGQKADKPYYVPDKEELLKYEDGFYFEKNKAYYNLMEYIKKNFLDHEEAVELCEDIQGAFHAGMEMSHIMNEFNRRDIKFKDMEHANETLQIVFEFCNNIRTWENNGHTPYEIFEEIEKPRLNLITEKIKLYKKIGRNDPCHCGSRKKYKKCCLDKDEK